MFKKEIILPILQRMDSKITFAEDVTIFLLYILQCESVTILNDKVYFYRYRVSSAVHSAHKNMLENINRIYNVLRPVFEVHQMSESLLNQLEMWMYFLVATGMNNYMGLSQRRRVLQYFLNMEEYIDKKIAIYGAGQMGQDLVWLYGKLGQKVYAWIDRNYAHFQHEGMDVQSVEMLEVVQDNLDVILIAVNNSIVVETIKKDLISRGISQEKIVWKEPISIY